MKLRIRGNTVRLRLSRGEIDALARDGHVEDAVEFGPSAGERLVYRIEAKGEASHPTATFAHGGIVITLPATVAVEWARSDRVGVEGEQPVGDGKSLRILVEKDFACLQPRAGEDDTDAFANPSGSAKFSG